MKHFASTQKNVVTNVPSSSEMGKLLRKDVDNMEPGYMFPVTVYAGSRYHEIVACKKINTDSKQDADPEQDTDAIQEADTIQDSMKLQPESWYKPMDQL